MPKGKNSEPRRVLSRFLSRINVLDLRSGLEIEILGELVRGPRTTIELVGLLYQKDRGNPAYERCCTKVRPALKVLERKGYASSSLLGREKTYRLTRHGQETLASSSTEPFQNLVGAATYGGEALGSVGPLVWLIREGFGFRILSLREEPFRVYDQGVESLKSSVACGQDQVIQVLREGTILHPKGPDRDLKDLVKRAKQYRWSNLDIERCLRSALDSLTRAKILSRRDDLLGSVLEMRYWSGAANQLGRAFLRGRQLIPATHILDVFLGLKRMDHPFFSTYLRAQGLEELDPISQDEVKGWVGFLEEKRAELGGRLEAQSIFSDAWQGAASEIALARRCLERNELQGVVLQVRYAALLLMTVANHLAGYKECPYDAGVENRLSKLKKCDPQLYQFLRQVHGLDSLKREQIVAVMAELTEANQDASTHLARP